MSKSKAQVIAKLLARRGSPEHELEKDIAELEANRTRWAPEVVERHERRIRTVRANIAQSTPILDELRSEAGLVVMDLNDLLAPGVPPQAVPILLRHLQSGDLRPDLVNEIARILTERQLRGRAWDALERKFRTWRPDDADGDVMEARWAIGNALGHMATSQDVDALIALAADRRFGRARSELVTALGRLRAPAAAPLVLEFLQEEDVYTRHSAVRAAGHLRLVDALPRLRTLLAEAQDARWRKEVQTAIDRISQPRARRLTSHKSQSARRKR